MQHGSSHYYSHGKLLISAEYLILDGASGLALPTKSGQHLEITPHPGTGYHFSSKDEKGNAWLTAKLNPHKIPDLAKGTISDTSEAIEEASDHGVAETLVKMLSEIFRQRPDLPGKEEALTFTSTLEFPRDWGLGSSSTFISNLAQWSETDPYAILKASLGGSGYDIACATSETPLTYTLAQGKPKTEQVSFNPGFKDQLYFVHLNKKQNSREGIARYRALKSRPEAEIKEANRITREMLQSQTLSTFGSLIDQHEALISGLLGLTTVKEALFPDYRGHLKSLGAWGGDFILATADSDPSAYFKQKGYHTIIPYRDMIL